MTGVRIRKNEKAETVLGNEVILSSGALHTPPILMRSGIGRGGHLRDHGIDVVSDRAGIGMNLNEHPTIAVSSYLHSASRLLETGRGHAQVAFRYS